MIIILIIVGIFVWQWWYWGLLIMMPFLGYFSLVYKEFYSKFAAARKFNALEKSKKEEIITLRSNINSELGTMTANSATKADLSSL